MLVCNVALRARRTIAVEIEEDAGAAEDLVVLAAPLMLIDEPANALDTLSAFTGEGLKESANATDSYTAGRAAAALLDEPASARDAPSVFAPVVYSVSITEAATATDAPDAGVGSNTTAHSLSAARAGLGSTIIGSTGGKTRVMTDLGAVS